MKKLVLICLALVMALGALGLGYAHWSQTLTITEVVNTGKFCVGIRDVGTNDSGPSLRDGGLLYPLAGDRSNFRCIFQEPGDEA